MHIFVFLYFSYLKCQTQEEVVVTGYGTKAEAENARKIEEQLLVNETKRVISKIPVIDIAEFRGKTVGITVRYILQ